MTVPAPDTPLREGRVTARADAGGGLLWVGLDTSPEVEATFTTPGQYTFLDLDGETGHFALAGLPGGPWEIILRAGGGAAVALHAADVGTPVRMTDALGAGFPVDDARGHPLFMVITAGAVAVARSVVLDRIARGDAGRTTLLLGTRARHDVPMLEELERFEDAGVHVSLALSDDPDAPQDYVRGYVQEALMRALRPDDSVRVFVAGLPVMVDAVRAAATSAGLDPGAVHTNH